MSASYTLHLPPDAAPGDAAALERSDLVRDGFSVGAFLAPMLWLFWHRHWLLGIGALAAVVGLALALWIAGAGFGTIAAAELLLHLLFGLEGSSLRRFAYGRRRPTAAVVVASSMAEAEAKSFARWLGPAEPRPAPAVSRVVAPAPYGGRDDAVIGLFPDLERRR